MRKTILTVAFLAAAAMAFFLSSCLPGGWGGPGPGPGFGGMGGGGGGMMGQGSGGGMMGQGSGGGMMGGQGGMGGGMMGGGNGMMGQGGMGGGMMGGQGGPAAPYGAPAQAITIDQAVGLGQKYAVSLGNPDVILDEVEEFTNNFYAKYREKGTGIHAFEMLIDKFNGAIYPEPGPNMMWNTKYGPVSSTAGPGSPAIPMSMTPQQALNIAQSFLDNRLPGVNASNADAFYGYYTVEVKKGGKTFGMLSVNGYSGQVWHHTWHGDFVQEKGVNG